VSGEWGSGKPKGRGSLGLRRLLLQDLSQVHRRTMPVCLHDWAVKSRGAGGREKAVQERNLASIASAEIHSSDHELGFDVENPVTLIMRTTSLP
jgi:hypothetical protein